MKKLFKVFLTILGLMLFGCFLALPSCNTFCPSCDDEGYDLYLKQQECKHDRWLKVENDLPNNITKYKCYTCGKQWKEPITPYPICKHENFTITTTESRCKNTIECMICGQKWNECERAPKVIFKNNKWTKVN
jgi:hypothetical protein